MFTHPDEFQEGGNRYMRERYGIEPAKPSGWGLIAMIVAGALAALVAYASSL